MRPHPLQRHRVAAADGGGQAAGGGLVGLDAVDPDPRHRAHGRALGLEHGPPERRPGAVPVLAGQRALDVGQAQRLGQRAEGLAETGQHGGVSAAARSQQALRRLAVPLEAGLVEDARVPFAQQHDDLLAARVRGVGQVIVCDGRAIRPLEVGRPWPVDRRRPRAPCPTS